MRAGADDRSIDANIILFGDYTCN